MVKSEKKKQPTTIGRLRSSNILRKRGGRETAEITKHHAEVKNDPCSKKKQEEGDARTLRGKT